MQLTVPKAPNALLASFMVVMLFAGASNVLLKDFMCAHHAPTGPNGELGDFNKPIFWTFLMKCGMALCLPFCCQRPNAPVGVFMLSCLLGFVVDVLVNMAYCAIAGSAIQMLRGGKVILTALLSYTVLGRRLHSYQIAGGAGVVLGITLVALSTLVNPVARVADIDAESRAVMNWKAICCCFAGEVIQSILWVYQEMVLRKYDIPPLQLVGLEGLFGMILGSIAMLLVDPLGVERFPEMIYQISHSMPLLMSIGALLVSMAFFNYSGVGVTKLGSAVHRSIIDVSRSVIIWTVELALAWHTFSISQLAGFTVLVFGALVYNNFLVIPYFEDSDEKLPVLAKSSTTKL
eukprot:TRINITY_DN15493_c0_g4_i1.p1 TRINITY_DN15493_c0_g4~~TRINITY_DN15493_c0_g4_i1.p1  ORF type:complete len:347 (-),score=56.60 TRINITY_DN15493_c0_g4_i1:110-1150(-)